jgi:hypothetical protein
MEQAQKSFQVTPEFKEQVTEILQGKKFGAVYPFMNLVNREGFTYTEQELNSLVNLLSEFPYAEVAEFFGSIKANVKDLETVEESEQIPAEN